MKVAAIDCGTNSTRLLIAERSGAAGGFTILDRRMRITRLGQGVNATKLLAPEAVDRTLAVLREYRAAMDEHGVERVRIAATSAARDAANREDFFVPAKEIIGAEPELLSGDEEARLSFRGATAELESEGGVRAAQAAVDEEALARAHERYRAERDAALPDDMDGPRPFGGVGGTRIGVKCLHAHYAWFLAGGDDPVGRWVAERLHT